MAVAESDGRASPWRSRMSAKSVSSLACLSLSRSTLPAADSFLMRAERSWSSARAKIHEFGVEQGHIEFQTVCQFLPSGIEGSSFFGHSRQLVFQVLPFHVAVAGPTQCRRDISRFQPPDCRSRDSTEAECPMHRVSSTPNFPERPLPGRSVRRMRRSSIAQSQIPARRYRRPRPRARRTMDRQTRPIRRLRWRWQWRTVSRARRIRILSRGVSGAGSRSQARRDPA